MWTHISVNVEVVWDDALYRVVAIWQEDDAAEPVVLEKGGRVALGADRSPEGIVRAAIGASQSQYGDSRPATAGS